MPSKTELAELLRKASEFKNYVTNELQYFIQYYDKAIYELSFDFDRNGKVEGKPLKDQKEKERFFQPIVSLLEGYSKKFHTSYENWERQIKDYGKIYFNNDEDRLHLSMSRSTFTNDDYGNLTPFGPWLVRNGELMGHHQIGVLDAMISQLPQPQLQNGKLIVDDPGKNGLIKIQMILILVQKQFISLLGRVLAKKMGTNDLREGWNDPPLVQLSDGNTGAWAADREIPVIIHVNKTLATSDVHDTRVSAYAAVAHEFGHKISDSFTKDRLIQDLIENIERRKHKHGFIWGSWMHEIFADAVGIRLLGKVAIDGLKKVLENRLIEGVEPPDLIIQNFRFDSETIPYEPHPNTFLRFFIGLELADQLGRIRKKNEKDENEKEGKYKEDYWDEWKEIYKENFPNLYEAHKDDFDKNIFHFKDQINEEAVIIDTDEINRIVDAILNTRLRSLPCQGFRLLLPGFKITRPQIFGITVIGFRLYWIPWIGYRKAKTLIQHLDEDEDGTIKKLLKAFEALQAA